MENFRRRQSTMFFILTADDKKLAEQLEGFLKEDHLARRVEALFLSLPSATAATAARAQQPCPRR